MRKRIHPVPAVMKGGMPVVSFGSAITIAGRSLGWKITFLVCVSSLVMTPARPTSEPVPAVVGTATIGAMASESARVHQSPTSSKSQTDASARLEGDQLAEVQARAAAEGDDAVMLAGLEGGNTAVRLDSTGFGFTSENTA